MCKWAGASCQRGRNRVAAGGLLEGRSRGRHFQGLHGAHQPAPHGLHGAVNCAHCVLFLTCASASTVREPRPLMIIVLLCTGRRPARWWRCGRDRGQRQRRAAPATRRMIWPPPLQPASRTQVSAGFCVQLCGPAPCKRCISPPTALVSYLAEMLQGP